MDVCIRHVLNKSISRSCIAIGHRFWDGFKSTAPKERWSQIRSDIADSMDSNSARCTCFILCLPVQILFLLPGGKWSERCLLPGLVHRDHKLCLKTEKEHCNVGVT